MAAVNKVPVDVARRELIVTFLTWAAEHDKGFGITMPLADMNESQARILAVEFLMSRAGQEWAS
jgi:hypothetical protein